MMILLGKEDTEKAGKKELVEEGDRSAGVGEVRMCASERNKYSTKR